MQNLINAATEFLSSKTNFQRVTGEKAPNPENLNNKAYLDLPNTLEKAIEYIKIK